MIAERFITPPPIEIQKNQILQNIHTGSIEGLAKIFDDIVNGLSWEKISTYLLLKKFKKLMPPHIPHDVNQKAAEALLSTDPQVRSNGQKAFLLFNAKTILSVVDSYIVEGADTEDDREDMTQSAILAIMEKFSKEGSNPNTSISIQIHRLTKAGVVEFLAQRDDRSLEGLKFDFFNKPEKRRIIARRLKEELEENKAGLGEREIEELARELSAETGMSVGNIKQHLDALMASRLGHGDLARREDDTGERLEAKSLKQNVEKVLFTLPFRDKTVIEKCIMEGKPYGKVSSDFNVSGQRIGQIKAKAVGKLRSPSRVRTLLPYVDTDLAIKLEEARHKSGRFHIRILYPHMSVRTEKQLIDAGIISIGDLFGLSPYDIRKKWQGKRNGDLILVLQNAMQFCKEKDNWYTIAEVTVRQDKEEFLWNLDATEKMILQKEFGLLDSKNYSFMPKDEEHFFFARAERTVVKKVKQKLNNLVTSFTQCTP